MCKLFNFFWFIAIIVAPVFLYSQNEEVKNLDQHCDCNNAWIIEDGVLDEFSMPKGYGKQLEIADNEISNPYFPTEEHNSLWIKIKFSVATDFELLLKPTVGTDDLDFTIWKVKGAHFCDSISNGILPVRSNLAKRNPKKGSLTGLKKNAGRDFARAGEGPSFSNSIKVNENDALIILIDAPYGAEGKFVADFIYDKSIDASLAKPELKTEIKPIIPTLLIKIVDERGEIVNGVDLNIRNVPKGDSVFQSENLFVLSRIRRYRNYTIQIEKRNYLNLIQKYSTDALENDTLILQIEKLKIGSKLQFQNILFVPDKAVIVESSYLDLRRIKNFLIANPSINVEIMGHVNGLGNKKKVYKNLSKERARSIYNYLIEEGIGEGRLTYAGYGADQLIFSDPQNDNEARINRRVEVKVTKI